LENYPRFSEFYEIHICAVRNEEEARNFGASGLGQAEEEEDSLLGQHKLHHSLDWHIEVQALPPKPVNLSPSTQGLTFRCHIMCHIMCA